MSIIIFLASIVGTYCILWLLLATSSGLIIKKKINFMTWYFILTLIALGLFYISKNLSLEVGIPQISALLVGLKFLPKKNDNDSSDRFLDNVFEEIGIKDSRKKFRTGIFIFWLSSIIGWIAFYAEIVSF